MSFAANIACSTDHAFSAEVTRPVLGRVYYTENCHRCGGSGIYSEYHGVCYECGGRGRMEYSHRAYIFPDTFTAADADAFLAEKEAAAADRHEAKVAKARAAKAAQFETLVVSNPEFASVYARYNSGEFQVVNNTDQSWDAFLACATDEQHKIYYGIQAYIEQYAPLTEGEIGRVIGTAKYIDTVRASKAMKATHEFVGTVGEKVTVEGEVVFRKFVDTAYGQTLLLIVQHATGTVKTFTTAKAAVALNKGDKVQVTGTVKSHDVYNGEKTTMLARVKVEVLF